MILHVVDEPGDPAPETLYIDLRANDDRSEAIVAGALVESALERAIKGMLVKNDDLFNSFFKGMGPLATFSAKINLAILLGILSDQEGDTLHIVRKIRNDFAHSTRPLDFTAQRISALCQNLATKCAGFSVVSSPADTARARYLGAAMLYFTALERAAATALSPLPDKSE